MKTKYYNLEDTYRHKGLRRQLVTALHEKGINDKEVLKAIGRLPRHYFLDRAFEEWAYQDKAFPIGNAQTISQPYTVAQMTSLLEVQPREKIMEIGTGSGYQAAILAILGARVYTIERQELLYKRAKALLDQLRPGNVRCFYRDGHRGLPEFAPFDKILVTAGARDLPPLLLDQLRTGGRLVIPIGEGENQILYRITRHSETDYHKEAMGNCRFVPFQEGVNQEDPGK